MPLKVCNTEVSAKDEVGSCKDNGVKLGNRYVRIFGWVIIAVAYGCLIPGLVLPLYYYTLQDMTVYKTMWTTIDLVYKSGGLFPAILLGFFGIAVPVIKLILMFIAHFRNIPLASKMVVWVSKWAIVDAIVACFIMAYFANALDGAIISRVDIGFMFFTSYCILSTIAALMLDDFDLGFSQIYNSRRIFKNSDWMEFRSTSIVALFLTWGLTVASLLLDTVEIGMGDEMVPMSIMSACHRMATEINSDGRPLALVVIFIVLIPVCELIFLTVLVARPFDGFKVRCLIRCLPQCGLLDVYTVSVIVMYIFLNQLGMMTVVIPAVGYIVLVLTLIVTVGARFLVERHLTNLFGKTLSATNECKEDENMSSGLSTISSGNTAEVLV